MRFLRELESYIHMNPNETAIIYGKNEQSLSYAEMWSVSGRVYSFLKEQGIGSEDIILINMKRSAMPFCVLLGVMRAGAAFVLAGDSMPLARIEQIKDSLNDFFEIDDNIFNSILSHKELSGFEPYLQNSKGFIIYTSGSTGMPKGIIHEYGKFEVMLKTSYYEDMPFLNEGEAFATTAPFSFLIVPHGFLLTIDQRGKYVVPPKEYISDTKKLMTFYDEMKISTTFFLPSYFKRIDTPPASLKTVVLGGERADNIKTHSLRVICCYAMSESAYIVFNCLAKDDNNIILKPSADFVEYEIKNNELCFKNEFTRGYVNNNIIYPLDADGFFHSSDIASFKSDGLIVTGRLDDMVKISGQRVDPSEIENAAVLNLNLKDVIAAGVEVNNITALVLFYLDDSPFTKAEMHEKLAELLPAYMVPSDYVKLDSFPKLSNGKVDKKRLRHAYLSDFHNASYNSEDFEASLCAIFKKVLNNENITSESDFYEYGGDSLKAITLITQFNNENLSIYDLIKYKTPHKIAKELLRKTTSKASKAENFDAYEPLKKDCRNLYPLTNLQRIFFANQDILPLHAINILPVMISFEADCMNPARLKTAADKAFSLHAALRTRLTRKDGRIYQYISEDPIETDIVNCQEDEVHELSLLLKLDSLFDSSLFLTRIFSTPKKLYLCMIAHHTIFDGISLHIILNNIYDILNNKPVLFDSYEKLLAYFASEAYENDINKSRSYFSSKYENGLFTGIPTPDFQSDVYSENTLGCRLNIKCSELEYYLNKVQVSKTAYYAAIALMSLAEYNKSSNVLITFTYSQRHTSDLQSTVGALISDIPIGIKDCQVLFKDKLKTLHTVNSLILDSCINSTLSASDNLVYSDNNKFAKLNGSEYTDHMMNLIFQDKILKKNDKKLNAEIEILKRPDVMSDTAFFVEILEDMEYPEIYFSYSMSLYKEESISRFVSIYQSMALILFKAAAKSQ